MILFEAVYYADVWGLTLLKGAQDIETAYHCVQRADHVDASLAEACHSQHIAALIMVPRVNGLSDGMQRALKRIVS